jgi:putative ABC transport system permease protein
MELRGLARAVLPVALVNVLRQRRRTAAGTVAVTFGVVAFLLAGGFIEWIYWAMREGTIKANIGHIQVVRPGYFKSGMSDPFGFLLPRESAELQAIRQLQHVVLVSPRISFSGLISLGDATVSYIADGVDPAGEQLLSADLIIAQGKGLDPSDPTGAILGVGLAKSIGAKVGDKVVVLANTRSGGVNAVEVTVRGTFISATKAYDDTALRLPLSHAEKLLKVSGAHRWVFLLDETQNTDAVVASVRAALKGKQFEVVPWIELADFYTKTVTLFSKQVTLMQFIIAAIIVLSITNTMMMNVMERTGEIGTAMALGLPRRGVLLGFMAEGVLLGVIGAMVGLALGVLLAMLISSIGIPMPPPPGLSRAFIGEILITPGLMADAVVLAFGTTLVASFYPAWKASRLIIVDALRRNR